MSRYDYNGKDNGVVCMYPWVHTTVTMENSLRPCCGISLRGRGTVKLGENTNDTLEDAFKWMRVKMLAGEKIEECNECYLNEAAFPDKMQPMSMRGQANTDYRLDLQNLDENFIGLKGMEISLDNICNLQCKMCDSMFSSNLYRRDEHLQNVEFVYDDGHDIEGAGNVSFPKVTNLGSRKPTKIPKQRIEFIKSLGVDWSELQHLKILGGEPFYSPNFEKLLDHLIKEGKPENLRLEIVSNCTNKVNERIIDKLNLFKEIILTCSLDGCNDYNSYQRWGSPGWKETLEIYKWYHSKIHNMVKHHVHSTYSLLNLNGLAGDVTWFTENYPECSVSRLIVKDGDYCPNHAPPEYLKWLEERWDKDIYKFQMKNSNPSEYVSMVDGFPTQAYEEEAITLKTGIAKIDAEKMKLKKKQQFNYRRWKRFREKIIALDKYYDSKLEDYNPELAEFIEEGWGC